MSDALRSRLFDELSAIEIIDPHTHINALQPASTTLADILGYHYYTELAHSAGMPRTRIEEPGLEPKEKVGRLIERMGPIQNTIQVSWFVEMAREFFDFDGDQVAKDNWEGLYDRAAERMSNATWADEVLRKSRLSGVFLTNDFDDPLDGFDTNVYIPCLRTDDLVFHFAKPEVRQRLATSTGIEVGDASTFRSAIGKLFSHFVGSGARACAISLPPDFSPQPVVPSSVNLILRNAGPWSDDDRRTMSHFAFWTLAEYCAEYRLPFDLMIGVNRGVYAGGVFQGQDLYDSRVSLIQYERLFNAFPEVTFPISVLASVTNQELVSYAWIFPTWSPTATGGIPTHPHTLNTMRRRD